MTSIIALGDILDLARNGLVVRQSPSAGGVPISRIETISKGVIDFRKVGYAGLSVEDTNDYLLKPGDILFSHINSREYIGNCAIFDGQQDLVHGMNLLCLRPKQDKILPNYLFYLIKDSSFRRQLPRITKPSVNQCSLTISDLKSLKVRLPPIENQRRIAGILDKADAIRRKRRRALAEIDALLRSTFLDMFGDPATNPHGFTLEPMRRFGRVMTGNTPPRADPENFGSHIEWIKSDNISDAKYFLTKAAEGLSEMGRSVGRVAPAGSILVTCIAGSPKSIGTAALADREVAFNQQINAIIPFQPQILGFLFVQIILAKRLIQRKSSNAMKGMVTKSEFEEVCIMRPPEEQQDRFSEWFSRFVGTFRKLRAAAEASEEAFRSLSQAAFRGGL